MTNGTLDPEAIQAYMIQLQETLATQHGCKIDIIHVEQDRTITAHHTNGQMIQMLKY